MAAGDGVSAATGKHTPWPWYAHKREDSNGYIGVHAGEAAAHEDDFPAPEICTVFPGSRSDETAWADANLIATAPDLLATLGEINYFLCYITEENTDARNDVPLLVKMGDMVRAAIAKATGEAV